MYSLFLVQKTPFIEHSCSVLVHYLDYFNCFLFYKHCFTKIFYINSMFKVNEQHQYYILFSLTVIKTFITINLFVFQKTYSHSP